MKFNTIITNQPSFDNTDKPPRIVFLDYLRALTFLLLVFDHTIHAYALDFGQYHFFKDDDRTTLADIFYLFDNSIIMPMLFLIFGLFIWPALDNKGPYKYVKNRVWRLLIPYIIGIPFVVPLLVYPKYAFNAQTDTSYLDFWQHVYFAEKLQGGGPFWVLFCLALYTFMTISIVKIASLFISRETISIFGHKLMAYPKTSSVIFITISCLFLGFGNFKWGAPWWIGLDGIPTQGKFWLEIANKIITLFHLQGSRFMLHAQYFLAGALIGATILRNEHFWHRVGQQWPRYTMAMVCLGILYISYTLAYIHEGVFNDDINRMLRFHFTWDNVQLAYNHMNGEKVLIRTTLQGIFIFFQVMAVISLSQRFLSVKSTWLCSLAACSYGIFLLHEVPVIWLQYGLNGLDIPIFFKVCIIFTIGLGSTWIVVKNLKRISWVNKII